MPSDRLLAQAARCLTANDLSGALDALLRGWRAARHPEIGARVQVLGDYLGRVLPSIVGDNPSHRHERWLEHAAEAVPVDQWRLRQGFEDDPMTRMYQRLRWLAGQPPDPRWTSVVADIAVTHALDYWPELAPSPQRIWRTCVEVLTALGDPQASACLDTVYNASIEENDPAEEAGWDAYVARVRTLMSTVEACPKETPSPALLDAFDAALAIRQAGPAPTAQAVLRPASDPRRADMLALVYAEPDDVDVRRVYADWLETTGAQKAELMRLQLQQLDAPKPTKTVARKIARLTDRYGMRWLGYLAPFVSNPEWHLGFPNAGDIVFRSQAQRDTALTQDAWRTFTEVHVRDAAILAHPNFAGVRKIGRSTPFDGSWQRLVPIEVRVVEGVSTPVGCHHLVLDAAAVSALNPDLWPQLKTIEVVCNADVEIDVDRLLALRIQTLIIWRIETADIVHRSQTFRRMPQLGFADRSGFRYRIDFADDHETLTIIWAPTHACPDFTPAVDLVRALPMYPVRILTPGYAHPAAQLQAWRDALAPLDVTLPRARRVRS